MSERGPLDSGLVVRWWPAAVALSVLAVATAVARRALRASPALAEAEALAQMPPATWAVMGAAAVAFLLAVWLHLRASRAIRSEALAPRALVDALSRLLWMDRSGEARRLCGNTGGYLAAVFARGSESLGAGPQEIAGAVEQSARAAQRPILWRVRAVAAAGALCLAAGVGGGIAVARIAPPSISLRNVGDNAARAQLARSALELQVALCAAAGALGAFVALSGAARLRARAARRTAEANRRALAVLLEDRTA